VASTNELAAPHWRRPTSPGPTLSLQERKEEESGLGNRLALLEQGLRADPSNQLILDRFLAQTRASGLGAERLRSVLNSVLAYLAQEGIRFGRKSTCPAAKSPKNRSEIAKNPV
jgi:hypothetical protein